MAKITESILSKFNQRESVENDILLSFYNDEISLFLEDYPSENDYHNVMAQLVALLSSKTPSTIIEILKPTYIHKVVDSADIPQFSDLSSAIYRTPEILKDHGNLSFEEMGRRLWPTERGAVADQKYGENHAKTAAQLGLATIIKGKINISSFGKIFLSLNPVQQAALIPNLWLKVPLFYNYFCTDQSETTLMGDMAILASSTQKRRLSNIRTIIDLINKGYYLRENNILLKKVKEEDKEHVSKEPLQVIYYGAPGTGKSYTIDQKTTEENSIRTTFHPDSDYASFVGAYKPTMEDVPISAISGKDVYVAVPQGTHTGKEKKIVYKYVPQAFLKAYVEAWKRYADGMRSEVYVENPYYLIIEEINRGNCAQIFGDLFQLLDRNNFGASSYPIHADEDIARFLKEDENGFRNLTEEQKNVLSRFKLEKDNEEERERERERVIGADILNGKLLLLPPNLHIWATMNTSDQSLFPIDSAFKRRWDWEYIPISYHPKDKKTGKEIAWKFNVGDNLYSWGEFLSKINPEIYNLTESSDKQMGYFFAKANHTTGIISEKIFLNKVLFYLWTEVLKDYNTGQEIFINPETKTTFVFTDFFDEEQNALESFIANLKLEEVEDYEPGDENETKGWSRFIVNGTKTRTIIKAMYLILRDAAKTNTYEELHKQVSNIIKRSEPVIKKIENPSEYKKENGWNKLIIKTADDVSIVVTNQWKKEMVPMVLELAENLDVDMEYLPDTDENTSIVNSSLSTTKKWYVDLLTQVKNKYADKGYTFQSIARNYMVMSTGIPGMGLVNRLNKRGSRRVELWIQPSRATEIFDVLSQHKEEIESKFGKALTWIESDESDSGNKHAEISFIEEGIDYNNPEEYNATIDWFLENGIKLYEAVKPYFAELK